MPIERSNEPEDFSRFEHQGWEKLAATYDDHYGQVTAQAVEITLNAAEVNDSTKLLDVCSGPGRLAAAAAKRGATVTGIDFSPAFVAIAKASAPGIDFIEGDAQSMPFESDSFDAVVCGFGLMHLPDPAKGLAEIRRVLKVGGRFSTTAWQPPAAGNGYGLMMGAIQQHGDLSIPLPHAGDAFQFGTKDRLTAALMESGFRNIVTEPATLAFDCDAPDALISGALQSAVRTRGLLQGQSTETLDKIRAVVVSGMKEFARPTNGYSVPMPAIIGSGIK